MLTPDPTGATQKYTRIGALELVRLIDNEQTLENVQLSCSKHFQQEDKFCDILLGESTISSPFQSNQLKKVVHCRFVIGEESNKEASSESSKHLSSTQLKDNVSSNVTSNVECKQANSLSVVPKSVTISHYLKAGQLIKPSKEMVELSIEEFNLELMQWEDPVMGKFILEQEELARGGFRKSSKQNALVVILKRNNMSLNLLLNQILLMRKNLSMLKIKNLLVVKRKILLQTPQKIKQESLFKCIVSQGT
jgi:hypothetical protein